MATAAERVTAGAELFDERVPNWHDVVDLDTLNTSERDNDVLGQLRTAGFADLLNDLDGEDPSLGLDAEFDGDPWSDGLRDEYTHLNVAWGFQVGLRRGRSGGAVAP